MTEHGSRPEGLARLDEEVRGRGMDRGRSVPADVAHPDEAVLVGLRQRREGAAAGAGADGAGADGAGAQGERPSDEQPSGGYASAAPTLALVIGATGVVFGDIGTSPLYSMRESLATPGLTPDAPTVMGVASLIFWALTLVVTLKYLVFIMRADNHGEGGILALLALLPSRLTRTTAGKASLPALLILVGAGLLYGDGALTPAISVLSAVEGVTTIDPGLSSWVVPVTCVILLGLFLVQSRGSATLGRLFGPVMVGWFGLIGMLGLIEVVKEPSVIRALLPSYAWGTLTGNGVHGFLLLGSIILAVTGAEALYADMGHFGRRPIRLAWIRLVMPALVLAYLGQAAKVITTPEAIRNPLYALAPNHVWVGVLLLFATLATVIASQALITGVFSLTRQATQLGYFPRVRILHTSGAAEGQIYLPGLNYLLMGACILLVLTFQSSDRLASAYGVAVAGTMTITSIAFYLVATQTWGWSRLRAWVLTALFLVVDLAFLLATLPKFFDGGYVPVAIGAVVVTVMFVWYHGHNLLGSHVGLTLLRWDQVHSLIETSRIQRTPGTAVFLASNPVDVPQSMSSHIQLLHTLPDVVRVVTIVTEPVPVVTEPDRFIVVPRGNGIDQVVVRSGFMETPFVPLLMDLLAVRGDPDYWDGPPIPELPLESLPVLPDDAIYFLSDRNFLATDAGSMSALSERLYAALHRNSASPTAYFGLPTDRVVTLATLVDL